MQIFLPGRQNFSRSASDKRQKFFFRRFKIFAPAHKFQRLRFSRFVLREQGGKKRKGTAHRGRFEKFRLTRNDAGNVVSP